MDKILPYTPIVWTMLAMSSDKAGPESSADGQAGVWLVVALLVLIAGCILLVVARWLVGFVYGLYKRVRQTRKSRMQTGEYPSPATGPLGPQWTLFGLGTALVSYGWLKDISAMVPTTEPESREAMS